MPVALMTVAGCSSEPNPSDISDKDIKAGIETGCESKIVNGTDGYFTGSNYTITLNKDDKSFTLSGSSDMNDNILHTARTVKVNCQGKYKVDSSGYVEVDGSGSFSG